MSGSPDPQTAPRPDVDAEDDKKLNEGASKTSSVVNLLNTILGAGALAMPSALSHMGISLGVFVILWSGLMSGFGLYLQLRLSEFVKPGSASFLKIAQQTIPTGAIGFEAAIAIKCFGVAVSYLIVIGDLMPAVIDSILKPEWMQPFLLSRQFWILASLPLITRLSFYRKLDSLKQSSMVALGAIVYLVILVACHYGIGDTIADRGEVLYFRWQSASSSLASFPVMVFAYTCHQNTFPMLNEFTQSGPIRARNKKKSILQTSIVIACCTYLLISVTGYLSYGSNIQPNIIGMYPPSISSTIGRAAIVILVMFSYPLQVLPCRNSLNGAIQATVTMLSKPSDEPDRTDQSSLLPQHNGGSTDDRSASLEDGQTEPAKETVEEIGTVRFGIMTTAIMVLSYTVALNVTSLERVLAYVGSTGSTMISFTLPGLLFYQVSDPDRSHFRRWIKDRNAEDVKAGGGVRVYGPSGEEGLAFDQVSDPDRSPLEHGIEVRNAGDVKAGDSARIYGSLGEDGLDADDRNMSESSLDRNPGQDELFQLILSSMAGQRRTRQVKQLRKGALALSCYGIVVMCVCLLANIFIV